VKKKKTLVEGPEQHKDKKKPGRSSLIKEREETEGRRVKKPVTLPVSPGKKGKKAKNRQEEEEC